LRETVHIASGGGTDGGHSLTYELGPDDSVTITHDYSDGAGCSEVKGKETFAIPADQARQVRQLLWRVRPTVFEGVESYGSRSIGCERKGPHDFGELSVWFYEEARARKTEGREMGAFELPYPQSCDTAAAREARRVVRHALDLLPESRVVRGYERSS
jgi:hypothetical protein